MLPKDATTAQDPPSTKVQDVVNPKALDAASTKRQDPPSTKKQDANPKVQDANPKVQEADPKAQDAKQKAQEAKQKALDECHDECDIRTTKAGKRYLVGMCRQCWCGDSKNYRCPDWEKKMKNKDFAKYFERP